MKLASIILAAGCFVVLYDMFLWRSYRSSGREFEEQEEIFLSSVSGLKETQDL